MATEELLYLGEVPLLFLTDERYCETLFVATTSSTPYAMYIVLGVVRHIIVHDDTNVVDVYTSCYNIRGYQ